MSLRFLLLASLFLATLSLGWAGTLAPVHYTLRFPEAVQHYVEVEADLPTDDTDHLEIFMPVWTPGSYLVREYSGNIDRISAATVDGRPLAMEKTTKNRWQIESAGQNRVRVTYRLYGWDLNVRSNIIEGDFAMINAASTYLTVANHFQRPYTVRVELRDGWQGVYTPLAPTDHPHTFSAPDFDTLIDSPLLAGSPQVDSFAINGVPHFLVTIGGAGIWNNARAARNFAQIAQTQVDFWTELPLDQPYYVFNLLMGQRGGLEHKQSFVMMASRELSLTRSGLSSWLSLVSHEYFHTWNGKRLRPVELGPFPYEHETYTKSLWVVEGITSYYQHLLLRRGGFSTRESYLGSVSGSIAAVEKTPGRLVQSMSDSSFDAWIKAYRPDENSVNTRLSYYGGGAVVALLLDVEIRRQSADAKSLDDVMRAAYTRFSGDRGYTEQEFITLTSEVAGVDLAPWFQRVVQNPSQLDYQPLLDWYGLSFEEPKEPEDKLLPNGLEPPDPVGGWLGADVKTINGRVIVSAVRTGTPAYAAGVYVDDELLALNGFRLGNDLDRDLRPYPPGTKVDLLVARREQLITLPIVLGTAPTDTWKLKIVAKPTPAQVAHLDSWLGPDESAQTKGPAESAPPVAPADT